MKNNSWPLMKNNILRSDLNEVIKHLNQEDPILTNGPKVKEFEEAWSKWLGVKYSVMVNSGSSANDLTMLAVREFYGVGEIIVPTLAWVSDIASVIHAGLTPKFVDIIFAFFFVGITVGCVDITLAVKFKFIGGVKIFVINFNYITPITLINRYLIFYCYSH